MRADADGSAPATAEMAQAIAEGLTLAEFDGGSYKTREHDVCCAARWTIVAAAGEEAASQAADGGRRGRLLGECSNLARELANEPGNTLTPREFARRAAAVASEAGVVGRDSRRDADRGARHGTAARRGARQRRAAAADGLPARSAGRARGAGARPGRQGHHVRHRRHFDQAGRRHGADEGRHGRRRGGGVRDARDRAARAPIRVIGIVPATENMPGGKRDQARATS